MGIWQLFATAKMSDLADRIRKAADEIGGLNQLAKLTGTPRRTLGYWLEGKQPKPQAIEAIAKATNVDLQWLLTGAGDMRPSAFSVAMQRLLAETAVKDVDADKAAEAFSQAMRLIDGGAPRGPDLHKHSTIKFFPQAASAGWGRAVLDDEGLEELDMEAFASRLLGIDVNHITLVPVRGYSMDPTLQGGDYAVVDRRKRKIVDDAIFVVSIDNDLYIKRAKRGEDGACCWLSDNVDQDKYPPICLKGDEISRIKVVGRVTNVLRRL